LASPPTSSLKKKKTGYQSFYTFGHRVRRVEMGRGNREGNNAFTYSTGDEVYIEGPSLNRLFRANLS